MSIIVSGEFGATAEVALTGEVAISLERAVAMGIVAAGVVAVSGGMGLNVHYSRNQDNDPLMHGQSGSTVYINDHLCQYDANGHLIARKDFGHAHMILYILKKCYH